MGDVMPRAYPHDPSFAHPNHPPSSAPGPPVPPPPPPPASYAVNQMSSQQQAGLRRRSLGGSPPGPYGAHEAPAPPPPPPSSAPHQSQQYQPRHMRPPSPPQQQQQQHQTSHPFGPPPSSRPQYTTSTPPSHPAQPAGRDLPGLTALHRPGSSMSISSMLGTDSHENPPPHFQPSPAQMQQAATSHPPSGYARNEYPNYARPQTPDSYPHKMIHATRPSRANSAGSPPSFPFGGAGRGSPTPFSQSPSHFYHHGPPQSPQNMLPHSSREGQPNPRLENPLMVSRPSSQPPPSADAYKDREFSNRSGIANFGRPSSFNERQVYPEAMHDRMREGEFPPDRRVREMQREVDRDRSNSSSAAPSSSPTHPQTVPFGRDRNAASQQQQQQQQTWDASPEHASHTGRPIYPHTSSSLANNSMYGPSGPNYPPYSHPGPGNNDASRDGSRQLAHFQTHEGSAQPIRSSISSPFDGLRGQRPHNNSSQQPLPGPSGNQIYPAASGPPEQHLQQQRRANNESPQPNARGLLGIHHEINRKGRLSPLPQAVQGAQGQISGPAGEPGIKSEFGRMFSGIGSGVGSGMSTCSPVGNGPPLGPNLSRREDGVDSPVYEGTTTEAGDNKLPRTSSRGGRRSKIKMDDARNDSESGDGRGTPSGVMSRGAKRIKHRHHHHPHHHHHHNKPEDDVASPQPLPLPYPGLNNIKRSSTPLQNLLVPGSHHHHHHHHHGHRSTPPANASITPAPIPFRKLVKTINSQDVLDQVSHLPRHHLGSTVYTQRVSASANRHSRNGFVYTPLPLPRLEGNENCTLTVRIPRHFLTPSMREQVVLRRALWGWEIYTDDSDVLAACIHAGWIRGEWPDDIDISLLDLAATKDPNPPKNKPMHSSPLKASSAFQMVMTSPPNAGPVVPPANMDLHVTILILPTLQDYASTISHGIRSRAWAGNHDGLSFKIEKLAWISEGTTPVEGRTGEDRRKRMRSMLTWKGGMGGSGVSINLNSKLKDAGLKHSSLKNGGLKNGDQQQEQKQGPPAA